MPPLSIVVGQRYGRLTVLRRVENDVRKRPVFECFCRCGQLCKVASNALRTGNTRSCGCLKTDVLRRKHWKRPRGAAALRALLSNYCVGARKRKLDFDLTEAQFARLISQCCAYCGAPPKSRTVFKTNGNLVYNGIDRKNPNEGYSPKNCQACCSVCNRMKGHRTATEFITWARAVVKVSRQHIKSHENKED